MDYQKMYGILIFFAGVVAIALGGGFGISMLIERAKRNQTKWKSMAEAGDRVEELDELRARIEDLERRGLVSGEVEAQYARLAELEERLDFTERLLAQRNDPLILPPDGRST